MATVPGATASIFSKMWHDDLRVTPSDLGITWTQIKFNDVCCCLVVADRGHLSHAIMRSCCQVMAHGCWGQESGGRSLGACVGCASALIITSVSPVEHMLYGRPQPGRTSFLHLQSRYCVYMHTTCWLKLSQLLSQPQVSKHVIHFLCWLAAGLEDEFWGGWVGVSDDPCELDQLDRQVFGIIAQACTWKHRRLEHKQW